MFSRHAILALGVSAALLSGCDDKKTETPPPAPNAAAPTVPAVPSSATPALPTAPPVTTPAVPSVTAPSTDTTPVVPATPSVTPPATPATPSVTPPATPAASGDVNSDAKATLAQFGKDMVARDWKAAGDDLKKLNDEKDKLSPDLQDAVKKAQTELDAAKATSGLKIPGLGGDSSNK
jgi:hypothetical protein